MQPELQNLSSVDPIVLLENVNFGYNGSHTLIDISFAITPGDFVGIIGPNGGGKTTLLRIILGFLKPVSGKVKVFGHPPSFETQHIAYVPQTLQYDKLFPISVMELVLSGRLSHLPWYGIYSKYDKEIALHSLEKVGLANFQNHSFGNLSGGQAQRALIARALASEPKLLLLDESTASVDAHAKTDIYGILHNLWKEEKMTILMVTHDLKTAIDQVQKTICVQGNVILLKPEEVCEHFALGLYHAPITSNKMQVIK
jgi:zinc transport system ATP-binding protein